ncbi:rhodanese-like domain-containing protein [Chryseotalea sanaruensis]|uniref:Rhodanese-like domain-containing protein n=1 Tax=Chryseotalea sanaruensis TaxID=2482724 RepID=A0A401U9H8_9BACT|nr:rhodanese-like domain-containing protein [Chryseotalea sanaruensis]GCC51537.1 rhodanese-like domain-containing protein [Chryseotalea sanaruensis]
MRLTLLLSMLTIALTSKAQVENDAYNLMLKTMLSHSVNEISVDELAKLKDVVLLDAREEAEYKVSHLLNARYVGYDNFNMDSVKNIDKQAIVIVYCSVGYRSEKIAEKLKSAGFANVSNLYGGIFEWVNQGNQLVDSDEKKTNNVHAYNKTWGIWLNKGSKVYEP